LVRLIVSCGFWSPPYDSWSVTATTVRSLVVHGGTGATVSVAVGSGSAAGADATGVSVGAGAPGVGGVVAVALTVGAVGVTGAAVWSAPARQGCQMNSATTPAMMSSTMSSTSSRRR